MNQLKLIQKIALTGVIGSSVVLTCGEVLASNLNLLGVADNSPMDEDGAVGTITLMNFDIGMGVLFTGTATEKKSANSDKITLSPGTFTNTTGMRQDFNNLFLFSNQYNFQQGPGSITASIDGELRGAGATPRMNASGNEEFELIVQASTFTNNPATASYEAPFNQLLPDEFQDSETKKGAFVAGPGILLGRIDLTLEDGEEFFFPDSIEATAATPDPGSVLGILAVSGLGLGLKRKKQA